MLDLLFQDELHQRSAQLEIRRRVHKARSHESAIRGVDRDVAQRTCDVDDPIVEAAKPVTSELDDVPMTDLLVQAQGHRHVAQLEVSCRIHEAGVKCGRVIREHGSDN
eukprot:CAMPEP_0180644224 /NCGR_PEP_ID=MMETSP1037_2-20121125/48292_1 /TAXON_ID=632150 /ORGANISM="Azadinium spinosum, Strain 3D9" /LENGTH=107 /DNA_ID=CAMNT_0022667901 /DNA_START=384 /DNA_END=707 /DNA_ORIENTATION=-